MKLHLRTTGFVHSVLAFAAVLMVTSLPCGAQSSTTATGTAVTNETLMAAYQREFVYLDNEIRLLSQRLSEVKREGDERIAKAREELNTREATLLEITAEVDQQDTKLKTLLNEEGERVDAVDTLQSIAQQADSRLRRAGRPLVVPTLPETASEGEKLAASVTAAFGNALETLEVISAIRVEDGSFFLADGKETNGKIIKFGQVGALGVSEEGAGTLAPAGGGRLRLVDEKSSELARLAVENTATVPQFPIFLYSSLDELAETKSSAAFRDKVKGGGPIGVIILILGAIALVLVVVRAIFLFVISGRVSGLEAVIAAVALRDWSGGREKALRLKGALGRVITATIDGLERNPEGIEDIIAEAILDEQPVLDRFRQIISVFAAVAPLLGLLGTVTGMIATFDIITQFGTGDPKLLSGGISEALITTEFGLEVAIPTLLFGNLLASWSDRINGTMEISALRLVNASGFKEESAGAAV